MKLNMFWSVKPKSTHLPDEPILLTEYGPLPQQHWLYRNRITHRLLTYYEPFLDSFWHDDVTQLLNEKGKLFGKRVEVVSSTEIFDGFYRVTEYMIYAAE